MPVTNADCGVWSLDEVYLKISANRWVCYNPSNDPGALWVWGDGRGAGQLGIGTNVARSSPVQIPGTSWLESSQLSSHTLARQIGNTLWGWGCNFQGRLGINNTVNQFAPVQIPGTQWSAASAGGEHSMALKSDGTLWVWGGNSLGNLGDLTTIAKSSPIQIPGTQWTQVSTGYNHSMARKSDGTLWVWGENSSGQLGNGGIQACSSPIAVPGTAWVDISAGNALSAARKSDGTLWAWGQNNYGQIGNNTRSAYGISSPTAIPGTQWVQVSSGSTHMMARKSDGTLWAWGRNNAGDLGINLGGNFNNRSSPVQIPGTQWVDIDFASNGIARKSDGTLWMWGNNNYGQLGDTTLIQRSSPVQIPGTQWVGVSSGGGSSTARKSL